MTPRSSHTKPSHYGVVILTMGTLAVFGALGLARFGYSALVPAMQADLKLDNTQVGLLATANLIGYLLVSAIGGALASRHGPRRVIAIGLAVAGAGMVLTGLATAFPSVLLWRTLTGMGSGAANVSVMGMLGAWFTARQRGTSAGLVVSGSSVGLIVVGLLVPRVLAAYGAHAWSLCWLLFGAITLLLAVGAGVFLRDRPDSPAAAQTPGVPPGPPEWSRVYRSRAVWHLGAVYVAFGLSYIIYLTFFVKGLISEGGYSQQAASTLYMAMGWVSLVCGLVWGALSDRFGRRTALVGVYLTHSVAFGLFAVWPAPAGFLLSALLFGLSAWSIPASMAAMCADVVDPRLAPAALGFVTLFFGVGQAIGPSLAGALADATGSLATAYLLAAAVALLGAIGALSLPRSQVA